MSVSTTTDVLTMTKCLVNGELVEAPGSCVSLVCSLSPRNLLHLSLPAGLHPRRARTPSAPPCPRSSVRLPRSACRFEVTNPSTGEVFAIAPHADAAMWFVIFFAFFLGFLAPFR